MIQARNRHNSSRTWTLCLSQ